MSEQSIFSILELSFGKVLIAVPEQSSDFRLAGIDGRISRRVWAQLRLSKLSGSLESSEIEVFWHSKFVRSFGSIGMDRRLRLL